MIPESDKASSVPSGTEGHDKQAIITASQRYLGTIVTTRDIDRLRSEELETQRQERIYRKFVAPKTRDYYRIIC